MKTTAIWAGLLIAVSAPLLIAAYSPLLQWRDPIYIAAGFAGIVGLCLLLIQPILATGTLPGLSPRRARTFHRITGAALVLCIIAHVAGLWITSPPDVIDALTFTSPTPFAAFGVVAMWAAFASALLAILRPRLRLRVWRIAHTGLALVIVGGTVVHALLIEGAMGTLSKIALCALVACALGMALKRQRVWTLLKAR